MPCLSNSPPSFRSAPDENARPAPGEDDDADGGVLRRGVERGADLLAQLADPRVERVGAVEGDRRDAVGDAVLDGLVLDRGHVLHLGFCVADDRLAGLLGLRVDDRYSVVDLAHRAGHDDFLLGEAHAPELHRQALELVGPARGLRLGARHLGHRPQPVQDAAGQADLLGELLVDVDRVEVSRRARVADGHVLVRA